MPIISNDGQQDLIFNDSSSDDETLFVGNKQVDEHVKAEEDIAKEVKAMEEKSRQADSDYQVGK